MQISIESRRLLIATLFIACGTIVSTPHTAAQGAITITNLGEPGINSFASDINDLGQVVGAHCSGSGSCVAFHWQDSVMTELPSLGGDYTVAFAINESGMVLGSSDAVVCPTVPPGWPDRCFIERNHTVIWENGTIIDLGQVTPAGNQMNRAKQAINESGQIIVNGVLSPGRVRTAYLWEDGVFINLGTLGGSSSEARALNDVGQVVGVSATAGGEVHPFLWQNGVMIDLGTLGGSNCDAFNVNNLSQVVGYCTTPNGVGDAFLWQEGVMTDLGILEGGQPSQSRAYHINDVGQVVGRSKNVDWWRHAFFWENGVMTDLDATYWGYMDPWALNNLGQVVGALETEDMQETPFLWQDGVMTVLPTLGEGLQGEAYAINNQGQAVGWTYAPDGNWYATLWTVPIPMPPPDEAIQNLTNVLADLVASGVLSQGHGQALTAKLDAALKKLDSGNTKAASNLLQAFINQTGALINSGTLSPADGQPLIDAATAIIDQLSGA